VRLQTDYRLLHGSPYGDYGKKLEYPKACAKELRKKPACMRTGLQLSTNWKGQIMKNAWCTAVGCHQLLNATFWRRVTATVAKPFNKRPLTILYGSTNPITLHKNTRSSTEYRYMFNACSPWHDYRLQTTDSKCKQPARHHCHFRLPSPPSPLNATVLPYFLPLGLQSIVLKC
jgi:hypothetical protein